MNIHFLIRLIANQFLQRVVEHHKNIICVQLAISSARMHINNLDYFCQKPVRAIFTFARVSSRIRSRGHTTRNGSKYEAAGRSAYVSHLCFRFLYVYTHEKQTYGRIEMYWIRWRIAYLHVTNLVGAQNSSERWKNESHMLFFRRPPNPGSHTN